MNLNAIFNLLKTTFRRYQQDHGSRLAASLSFYSAISITPLLMTLVMLVEAVVGPAGAEQQFLAQVTQLMGPQVGAFMQQIVAGAQQQPEPAGTAARLLEAAVLLWGSANVFLELQNSLNFIWNVQPEPGRPVAGMLSKRLFSFGLVIALGFLILVSLAFSAGVSILLERADWLTPNVGWIWPLVNLWLTLFGSALLFGLLYKHVPDVDISWPVAWMGASVTGVLFTLGTVALKALLGEKGIPYGVTGSLIVFLLWVYYSAQIVFFGAELTQVYAESRGETPEHLRRRGGRDIAVIDPTESP